MMLAQFMLVLVSVTFASTLPSERERRAVDYRAIAEEILKTTPLIDGHNDIPYQIRRKYDNRFENFTLASQPTWHTDLPRLKQGMMGTQFWSAFSFCDNRLKNAVRLGLEQVAVIKRMVEKFSNDFVFVTTAQGIRDAKKAGKIGSMIGLEGGHMIDSSLGTLRMFYKLGVRYMTLTHSCHTPWASSCTPKAKVSHNGLNSFGKTVVKEMNRLGMLVDISHVSPTTMHDVLDTSTAPVIFSHSSAYALCKVPRNVPDDVLKRLPANGGVVMINFYNDFVVFNATKLGVNVTLQDVANHIDHVKNVSGIDHVGLGADYDGVSNVPQGLEDVSKYPDLLAELLKRGYSDEDIRKLAGDNLIRVMDKAEKVAEGLKSTPPYDDYQYFANVTCRPSYGGSNLIVSPLNLE